MGSLLMMLIIIQLACYLLVETPTRFFYFLVLNAKFPRFEITNSMLVTIALTLVSMCKELANIGTNYHK